MNECVLNYYSKFKCIAGDCKHTCCAGWKMNIDEQTLEKYRGEKSIFSNALKEGINLKKSCFKVDKKGRCAFLNDKGLCKIIINLGEKSLCQVCRDHPRFRSYFGDTVEMGLGFCCEQATSIILTFEDKIQPIPTSDFNNEDKLDFIKKSVLEFKNSALAVIQDRQLDVNQRIEQLLSLCNAKVLQKDFYKSIKTFLSLERLNKSWAKRLKSIKNKEFTYTVSEDLSLCAEQFLANCLYRHLSDAEDATWVRARAIACALSWFIIYNIFEQEQLKGADNFNLLVDIVREYSAEVEYSQKNLDKLFSFSRGLIKKR